MPRRRAAAGPEPVAAASPPVAGTLVEIAQVLESGEDAPARVRRALELAGRLVPYDLCALLEVGPAGAHEVTVLPEPAGEVQVGVHRRLVRWLRLLLDQAEDGAAAAQPADAPPLPHGAYLTVPLIGLDQVTGLLFVGHAAPEAYREEHVRLLAVVAAQLAAYLTALRHLREAQDAIRMRDDLLASASHDLKSPLTAIQGQAQLLERRAARVHVPAPERDRLTAGLRTINTVAKRMAAMINELVDVGRLRVGRELVLERHPTDLVALARQMVAEAEATAEGRLLRVEAAVAEVVGDWDAFRLERVLGNLLTNALKYSPAGREVTVRVDRDDDADGQWAVLAVQDRGVGIPAADQARVFERYFRAGNVLGRIRGSGIGLAGAQQIVAQHGGAIVLESREGVGSTFTVRLPLAPPTAADAGADDPGRPG